MNGLEQTALAVVDGVEPRKLDGAHFDPSGSEWLARWMLPQFLAVASHVRG